MRLLKNIKSILIVVFAGFFISVSMQTTSLFANEGAAEEHGEHGESEGGISKQIRHDDDLIKNEIKRHFHNNETGLVNPTPLPTGAVEQKSLCIYCHGSYPHITNRAVRAMFNFHKIFIACETCHYKERFNKEKVGYRWYDGTSRTIRDLKKLEEALGNGPQSGPAKTLTIKDIYKKYGFKISPYKKDGDSFTMMIAMTDDPYAQEYIKIREKLSADQQGRFKAKIHGSIDPVGSDCIDCHQEKSQLPFKSLGFTDGRIKDLLQTEAAGLFKYYSRDPKYKGMTFKIRRLSGIWGIDFKKQ